MGFKVMILSFLAGLIGFAVFGITNFAYNEEILWVYLAIGIAMLRIYSQKT